MFKGIYGFGRDIVVGGYDTARLGAGAVAYKVSGDPSYLANVQTSDPRAAPGYKPEFARKAEQTYAQTGSGLLAATDMMIEGAKAVPVVGTGVRLGENIADVGEKGSWDPSNTRSLAGTVTEIAAIKGGEALAKRAQGSPTATTAAQGVLADLQLVGPKKPLDPTSFPRHPSSRVASPENCKTGTHVYVVDEFGSVRVADNASHMHPQVLGNAKPARAAGEVTIDSKGRITELNNASGTFQFNKDSLPGAKKAFERQGFQVADDVAKGYDYDR